VIGTTVQPKGGMFLTDAKLLNRARERLVRLAKKLAVNLRQPYARVGNRRTTVDRQRRQTLIAPTIAWTSADATSFLKLPH